MFMFIYTLFKMINCTYFEFSPQATGGRKGFSSDTMSQMSMDSATSGESKVTGGCFLQTMTLLQVPPIVDVIPLKSYRGNIPQLTFFPSFRLLSKFRIPSSSRPVTFGVDCRRTSISRRRTSNGIPKIRRRPL